MREIQGVDDGGEGHVWVLIARFAPQWVRVPGSYHDVARMVGEARQLPDGKSVRFPTA